MADESFLPGPTSRVTPDFAARLFIHHLGLAISYWEIGNTKSTTIDNAASRLTRNAHRRILYKLIPILDEIYKEMDS